MWNIQKTSTTKQKDNKKSGKMNDAKNTTLPGAIILQTKAVCALAQTKTHIEITIQ